MTQRNNKYGNLRNMPESWPFRKTERDMCPDCGRRGINTYTLLCDYCGESAYLPHGLAVTSNYRKEG